MASGVTVCKWPKKEFGYAKTNPRYPFSFLLSAANAHTGDRRVRKAARSVQFLLRSIGVRDQSGRKIVVDGSYGPQTASAVRMFQQLKNLVVDGKVGPQTWRVLSKSCWLYH